MIVKAYLTSKCYSFHRHASIFSSPEHNLLMVSYCDVPVSGGMCCQSSTISLHNISSRHPQGVELRQLVCSNIKWTSKNIVRLKGPRVNNGPTPVVQWFYIDLYRKTEKKSFYQKLLALGLGYFVYSIL